MVKGLGKEGIGLVAGTAPLTVVMPGSGSTTIEIERVGLGDEQTKKFMSLFEIAVMLGGG
jgi:hypothetical protein